MFNAQESSILHQDSISKVKMAETFGYRIGANSHQALKGRHIKAIGAAIRTLEKSLIFQNE